MRRKILFLLTWVCLMPAFAADKIVIAHRGASGYLPEHTLAAKAMAHAMGVDYIEQDVVMTKDHHLVVLHDHYLDRVTDVAEVFPGRQRDDGRYYVIDFTLEEIRQLKVSEGFKLKDGRRVANYPGRFPLWAARFQVTTLEEEIELIQGLNQTRGVDVGLYPEIKSPWFHHQEGYDIALATLKVLQQYGYTRQQDKIFLQCFDAHELQRIKTELLPQLDMDIKLVQLIAETKWKLTYEQVDGQWQPYSYDWMFKPGAMAEIARYADGVGPWKHMIIPKGATLDHLTMTDLVSRAHAAGLLVHPYTFRLDQGRIPPYAKDFEQLLDIFFNTAGVDGVFTDFPDRAVQFLRQQR